MSSPPNWNLLVIASDPWDAGLINEALSELEESQYARAFQRTISWQRAECLDDALDLAATGQYDAALCDLQLSDCEGLHTFLRLLERASKMPVIVLVDRASEDLGIAAMREGASDYLLKEEFDCIPLARSLRYAMDRSQTDKALRTNRGVDKLTGLLDEEEFRIRATYALELAASLGLSTSMTVAELVLADPTSVPMARTLDVLEIAERMRSIFEPPDLVGRMGPARFAALRISRSDVKPPTDWISPSGIAVVYGKAQAPAGAPSTLPFLMGEAVRELSQNRLEVMDSFPEKVARRASAV